jgi:1,4-alpha-glucan branching enzyme
VQDGLASVTSDPLAPSLTAHQLPIGGWELRVQAPGARRVELNGDFTGWQPTALASSPGGSWTLTVPLAPGTYQVNLRIDDGPWMVPAGLLPLTDEFGGRVGLLVIPPGTGL